MAKLYFRHAPMNSGKSTSILQTAFNYSERDQRAIIVKPADDTKSDKVLSRTKLASSVDIHVYQETNLYDEIKVMHEEEPINCVLVDEAQFLSAEHVDQLFLVVTQLNIPVIAYGLRTNFSTHAFSGSLRLFELAHSIEEMKTICRCGRKAIFNGRKVAGEFVSEGPSIGIDGKGYEYESLCGQCYVEKVGTPQAKA